MEMMNDVTYARTTFHCDDAILTPVSDLNASLIIAVRPGARGRSVAAAVAKRYRASAEQVSQGTARQLRSRPHSPLPRSSFLALEGGPQPCIFFATILPQLGP